MAFGLFRKSSKKEEDSSAKQNHGPHYLSLRVSKVIQETKDAIQIVFDQPESGAINYQAGQFLTLIATIGDKEVRRAYSLCSAPSESHLAVAVKRVENGLMSNWLADHLKGGELLKVLEPMGQFVLHHEAGQKKHYILFAGGSGITPMMSLIKSTLTLEPESVVSLIYCNRDIDSIIFHNELDTLQQNGEGRVHVIHVLDNAPMNWQGYSGLLNHELLSKLFERIPDWGIDRTLYLMCGPEGMMKNVESLLTERNVPKDKLMKESFVQGTLDKSSKGSESVEAKAFDVTIRYDGEEFVITVPPNKAILATALDNGYDLPYSCQSGLCTACRGKALSGEVRLDEEDGLSASERAEGYVLTCVGHPMSDNVVIEIG